MTKLHTLDLIRNGERRSLTYCDLIVHRGSTFEPFHRRIIFKAEDDTHFTGLALDADNEKLLQVEAETAFQCDRALRDALLKHFKAFRELGKAKDQERAAQIEASLKGQADVGPKAVATLTSDGNGLRCPAA